MKRFKTVLVGVDLAGDSVPVCQDITKPTLAAVGSAIWLAKNSSAKVTFLYVLEVTVYSEHLRAEGRESDLIEEAEHALDKLVRAANKEGVVEESRIIFGKSWFEIIREVQLAGHDLVVVGTRQRGPVATVMFGSTDMKLFRKCPCPIWITKHEKTKIGLLFLLPTT